MGQHRGLLTPEERARITELQDLLIDRFVEHRQATAEGRTDGLEIWRPKSTIFSGKRRRSRSGRRWDRLNQWNFSDTVAP
jgi:hypothetical protein